MSDNEVQFEIRKHIGKLAEYATGWNKEINIVSWNGGTPKYDIRDWDEKHQMMSKGITLHKTEMDKLIELMTL